MIPTTSAQMPQNEVYCVMQFCNHTHSMPFGSRKHMFCLTIVIVIQYYPKNKSSLRRVCGLEDIRGGIAGFPKDNTTRVVGDTKETSRFLTV